MDFIFLPLASGGFLTTSKVVKNENLLSVQSGVLSFVGNIGEIEWKSMKHSNLINTKHLQTQAEY